MPHETGAVNMHARATLIYFSIVTAPDPRREALTAARSRNDNTYARRDKRSPSTVADRAGAQC